MTNKTMTPVTEETTKAVLMKVEAFQQQGELKLPSNYSAENALKSAYLMLKEQQTRDNKPVLEACTRESIASCLLDMVVQGLSPLKRQCYFIPYGDKLTLSRSYAGSIAVAKRVSNLISATAQVIYQNDIFKFCVDPITGQKKIIEHSQDLESLTSEIVGAYAVLSLSDDTRIIEIMTISQIQKSWAQGATKGSSPAHKNFPDEMAKKTVLNRACKLLISTSDDSELYTEEQQEMTPLEAKVALKIQQEANKEPITIKTEPNEQEEEPQPEPEVRTGYAPQF